MPASSRVLLAVGVGLVALPLVAQEAPPSQSQTSSQTAPLDAPLSSLPRVRVNAFAFQGNTVFSHNELAAVVAPFTNRELTAEELEDARRKLTEFYIQKGFINSGAVLEEQKVAVAGGTIKFRITEGRLTGISL
ncbi:MAG TPA: POTRA domain-containing protein, partial [Abditibacteriaceae bacterium]